jgi:preprotein translocase subunit SecA
VLCCAVLCCAVLCCAVLCCAVLCRFLGLTVGTVQSNTGIESAQAAYSCHITYVTGQELCFNYLKDNTAQSASELVSICYC